MRKFNPTQAQMFMDGTLLEWCDALRGSYTGMADPLPDPDGVRRYIRERLEDWDEPTSEWDGLVRALCDHSLRTYHAPEASKASPPSGGPK